MIGLIDVTKAKCSLSEYARLCRYHDWSACMSDSFAVYRRGESNRKLLASVADTSQNHKRIWQLALSYHGKFTGGWTYEDGWRWAGAYLWCHGIDNITDEQAKNMVADPGTMDDYDRDVSGLVNWKEVDKVLKSVK